jgi:5-formyltetrahydrofolate cyclo-ligase
VQKKEELTPQYIRTLIRRQRSLLSKSEQQQKSQQICQQLKQQKNYRNARRVALYIPVKGEADPTPLLSNTNHSQKTFFLPIISPVRRGHLCFIRWHKGSSFRKNRFGIPEPIYKQKDTVPASALDLVLTPLVGFDAKGNRLGMGGGFYDRTFAFKRYQTHKPTLIGFAYQFQQVDKLPSQAWDVPLDGWCTEEIYKKTDKTQIY